MIVVGGSESLKLARDVSRHLDCEFIPSQKEEFSDEGGFLKDPGKLKGEKTILVQSTCYPTNENYMELFHLLDTAKKWKADKITAVVPYFGYARQDKRFEPGEAISRQTMIKLIETFNPDQVYTVDLHAHDINCNLDIFTTPAYNITAAPALAKKGKEKWDWDNPILIGPDENAEKWARKGSEAIDSDWDYLIKKRLGPTEVEITPKNLEVEGREVVLIDDMIGTGGTMVEAIGILKDKRAKEVYSVCTHPVLSEGALENIREAGAKGILGSNTIESEVSEASVAPLIAGEIKN